MSPKEVMFNGKRYLVDGEVVRAFIPARDVHRNMQWGKHKPHWRTLTRNSPLRDYLIKRAAGLDVEPPSR